MAPSRMRTVTLKITVKSIGWRKSGEKSRFFFSQSNWKCGVTALLESSLAPNCYNYNSTSFDPAALFLGIHLTEAKMHKNSCIEVIEI